MLSQTEVERYRYEARLKAQRDHHAMMEGAKSDGLRIGEELGLKKGLQQGKPQGIQEGIELGKQEAAALIHQRNINLFERLLKRLETPKDHLEKFSVEELARLAEELQAEVLKLTSTS